MANKLTWFGHATLGLETGGKHLLIDPFFSGNPAATVKANQVAADFILVTHGHGDHVGDAISIANARRNGHRQCRDQRWMGRQGVVKLTPNISAGISLSV